MWNINMKVGSNKMNLLRIMKSPVAMTHLIDRRFVSIEEERYCTITENNLN